MIPNTMLCCGGEKESTRDLKSAQNTPSRQMLPYSQQQQLTKYHFSTQKTNMTKPKTMKRENKE